MWNSQNASSPADYTPRKGRLTPILSAADLAILREIDAGGYLTKAQAERAAYLAAAGYADKVDCYPVGFMLTTYGEIAVQENS